MAKLRFKTEVKLVGAVRHRRSALMVSTALQATAMLVLSLPADAQPAPNARPTGGAVVAGTASISQSPETTTVNQSTQRAAVNWQSFNVGSQHTVQFQQPSATAMTLNRVVGSDPSQIAGKINANGQVVLVNQSGVTFYKGAQVNTNGLIVSAIGISNENFMTGKMVFDQPGNPNARIENAGTITIKEAGLAALVAPQVANSGVINARLGHVVLAGARTATLDMYGDGLLSLDVTNQVTQTPVDKNGKAATALVTNSGTILADGGTVQLTARAADGVVTNLVDAGGQIRAATVGGQTGTIALNGVGGSIVVEGQLAAPGEAPGSVGGDIAIVTTGNVDIAATARIDASGQGGGGVVAIGTTLDRAKGGPSVTAQQTAANVSIAEGATIAANAISNGSGGKVTVLSTGITNMNGLITAKGGANGGNGGFVEVSGEVLGINTGSIDVTAPLGAAGSILFDPQDLDIVAAGSTTDVTNTGSLQGVIVTSPDQSTNITVSGSALTALSGNLVIEASRNLTIDTPLDFSNQISGTSVQFLAGNNLTVNQAVSTAGGALTLSAAVKTDGSITFAGFNAAGALTVNAALGDSNTGDVVLSAGTGGIALGANLTVATGSFITLNSNGAITQTAGGIIDSGLLVSSSGSATLTGDNTITQLAANMSGAASLTVNNTGSALTVDQVSGVSGITVGTGDITLSTTTSGDIILNKPIDAAGQTVTLNSAGAVTQAAAGAITADTLTSTGITGAASLIAASNTVATLGAFSAGGDISFADTAALTVGGNVQSTNGNVYLQSSGFGITVSAGASVSAAAGHLVSFQSPRLSIAGSVSGGTFEFAPPSPGSLMNLGTGKDFSSLSGITATNAEIGGVTIPGSGFTITATSIVFAKSFDADNLPLALNSTGAISESSSNVITNVATLSGSALSANLTNANTVANLGNFTTTGGDFTLNDAQALTVIGTVAAGTVTPPSPNSADSNTISLTTTTGGITIGAAGTPGVLDSGTVSLNSAAAITQPNGTIISNSLNAAATNGDISLIGANNVTKVTGITTTAGDIALVFGSPTILTGTYSGNNLFFEVAQADGTLQLGNNKTGAILLANAAIPRITLVADNITEGSKQSTITATNGSVEIAPFTSGTAVSLAGSAGAPLLVDNTLFGDIATGTVIIGQFTDVPNGSGTKQSGGAISIDGAVDLTGNATTLDLESPGAITEPSGSLTVTSLSGNAASASLLASNAITNIAFTASSGDVQLIDSVELVAGTIKATKGNIFLESTASGGIDATAAKLTASGSGTIGLEADAFTSLATGTFNSGTFELAPASLSTMTLGATGGLSIDNADMTGVTATLWRFGAVTVPPGSSPTATVNQLSVGGAFGSSAVAIELDSIKTISGSGVLTAGTLTGSAGTSLNLSGANSINNVGSLTATTGISLNDAVALNVVSGATVDGGSNTNITDTDALIVNGTVKGTTVSLSGLDTTINGAVTGPTSVNLTATGGGVSGAGVITTALLTGSATTSVNLTGANQVTGLGNFIATSGFSFNDAPALTVTSGATIDGGSNTTITDAGALSVGGTVQGAAVGLSGSSVDISGLVTSPTSVSLSATSAGITESGTITTVLLTGSAVGDVSLTGATPSTNQIADLGAFTSTTGNFTLTDAFATGLTVTGAVTVANGKQIELQTDNLAITSALNAPGGTVLLLPATASRAVTFDPLRSVISLSLLQADLDNINAGTLAVQGASVTLNTPISLTGFANTASLDATTGSVSGVASLTVNTLTGVAATDVSLTGANSIDNLGNFTAVSGFLLSDAPALTVLSGATVDGGSNVTIFDGGTLNIVGTVKGTTVGLLAPSISIEGAVSGGSSVTLIATAGGISGAGIVTTPLLTGSATTNVSLTGANSITTLGNFTAAAGLTLNDTPSLTVLAGDTVNGGLNATITDTGTLTIDGAVNGSAVSLRGADIDINGVVTGPANVDLTATTGGISGSGVVATALLTGSTATSFNLNGANQVTGLGDFADTTGFTFNDTPALTVIGGATADGGSSVNITDASALTITGTVKGTTISLSAPSIAIGGALTGPTSVTLTSTLAGITGGGVVTTALLTGSAAGNVDLTGANAVSGLGNFTAATGFTFDNDTGLSINAGVTVNGGPNVTIIDTAALTVTGAITGSTIGLTGSSIDIDGAVIGPTSVNLASTSGGITGAGVITTPLLTGSAATNVSLTGANQVTSLGNFTATTGFIFDDVPSLTVNSGATVDGGSSVSITDTGALAITGTVHGSTVALTGPSIGIGGAVNGTTSVSLTGTSAGITGAGVITTGLLTGSAAGNVSLTGPNQVTGLGAFTASTGFAINNIAAMTVDGGATVNGGTNTSITDTGPLTVAGTILGATVGLSAQSIAIDGAVTGPTSVTLSASAGITGGGVITTALLTGNAGTSLSLTGANQISDLGNFTANAGFMLNDVPALTVDVGATVNGGTTVTLDDANALTISGAITGLAGVTLTSSGSISGAGVITTGALGGSAGTDVKLTGANQVSGLANFTAVTGFTLDDVVAVAVNAGATVDGGTNTTIVDTGALTVNGTVKGTTVALTGSSIGIGGTVDGPTSVTLTSTAGGITGAGAITTALLTGSAATSVNLTGANSVATLGNFTATAGFALNNASTLSVNTGVTVNGGSNVTLTDKGALTVAGNISGTTVSLEGASLSIGGAVDGPASVTLIADAGDITGAGVITTGLLTGASKTGQVNLSGANQVTGLGNFSATTGFTLNDVPALTVLAGDTVSGGTTVTLTDTGALTISGMVTGPAAVTLVSASSISGTGAITTGALTGSAGTSVDLIGANQVSGLGNFKASTGFTLDTVPAMTVLAGNTVNGGSNVTIGDTGDLTVTGTLTGTTVALNAGNISIGGAVTGPAGVTLTSGGTISGGGVITTPLLTGSAGTSVNLTGSNQITGVGNFSAANGFTLDNGPSLTINAGATVNGGTGVTISEVGNLTDAGAVIANTVAFYTSGGISITGAVNGSTSVNLNTTGPINGSGIITTPLLTGRADGGVSLTGANQVTGLGDFFAGTGSGSPLVSFTLNDIPALTVSGTAFSSSTMSITDAGALTVNGSLTGAYTTVTAPSMTINGSVSGTNSVSLVASSGGITGSGVVSASNLGGSAATNVSLTGANTISVLNSFTASTGFTLNDISALAISSGATVNGGSSATLSDTNSISVNGTATGTTVSLTAPSIDIAGAVTGPGGVALTASNGGISGNGVVTTSVLTGSSTGTTSLTGANQIAAIGGFAAGAGFTLNDEMALSVNGALLGGSSVAISDPAAININNTVSATAVAFAAASVSESAGAINTGTLTSSTSGFADFTGSNQIASLNNISATGLTLNDNTSLSINGIANGGQSASLNVAGTLTINGVLVADVVNVNASGGIIIPGTLQDANSVTLHSGGGIEETGALIADLLTGSANGDVLLEGNGTSNQVSLLANFSTPGSFTLNDSVPLTISGTLSAPKIVVNDPDSQVTLADGVVIATGGSVRPKGVLNVFPTAATSGFGAFFVVDSLAQFGTSNVVGYPGASDPAIMRIDITGPGSIAFAQNVGLVGKNTWLILSLNTGQATGSVFVQNLDILRSGPTGSTSLNGSVGGLTGAAAAAAAGIQPTPNSNFRFNSCPIHSVNCMLLLQAQGIPTANPLNDIAIGTIYNPNDQDDLLLPIVSDQDY